MLFLPFFLVEELFTLLTESLGRLDNEEGHGFDKHWKDVLPKEYHCFAGNYHKLDLNGNFHRFEIIGKDPFVGLKLAPPMENNSVDFFNAQDYSKRLIGLVRFVDCFIFCERRSDFYFVCSLLSF